MNRTQYIKAVRYCAVCGALFLVIILCWTQIWRLAFMQAALEGMKAIVDDAIRHREYYWVGRVAILSSALGAGAFVVLFYILEIPLLGPRPKGAAMQESKLVSFWGLVLLCLLTLTSENLYCMCYIHPWAFFGTAAVVFVLRLRGRTDYFPAYED